jgi:ABC-type multidrug transport system fused ATPase/permease subunit
MGYVGRMPTLFRATIRENIAYGGAVDVLIAEGGDPSSRRNFKRREVTDDEIFAAAKLANAHSFTSKLPEGYDTMLGERGALQVADRSKEFVLPLR